MAYKVVVRPSAQRQLGKLRGSLSAMVHGALLTLGDEPRPRGALKLTGMRNIWRLRVRIDGRAWRVVYQIDDAAQLIVILRVAARDESTYRRLM